VLGALWAFPWSQAPDTPPLAPEEPAPVLAELHLTTGPEPVAPVEIVSAPAPAEPVVAPAVVATVAVPEPLPAVLPVLPAMRRPAPRPQAVTLTASHLPVSKTHFTRAELRCQHVVQQARTGRSVTEDKGRMRCRAGR
jgi:hypothetical protein